jgi:hypothetical protein
MVASIPWISSALKIITNEVPICYCHCEMHVRKHFYSSGLKKSVLGTKFPDAFSCHFASSLGLDDHLLPLLGGIPLGCGLDDRGVEFRHGLENFSSPPHPNQPVSHPMGTWASFPGGKAAEAWIWPLTSFQCRGREYWSYTSTPTISLHGVVLG